MRAFLGRSMASFNQNKLRGTLAEIDFRNHLAQIGFDQRVSPGGWIARRARNNAFGHSPVAIFPEIVQPGLDYSPNRALPVPSQRLHSICTLLHQTGIASFFCAAAIPQPDNYDTMSWQAIQLGVPAEEHYVPLIDALAALQYTPRPHPWNFLRYHTDAAAMLDIAVPEEFSKEHLRVSFSSRYFAEISDIDGVFWGQQHTYPIEIKEKTPAPSAALGPYFGLDMGPFVKLSFYATMSGTLHSMFVVREIDNVEDRNLVQWWFITFNQLARFASWVAQGGGTNMAGGGSTVVKIPRQEFQPLNAQTLAALP
jgi:hypothetical protein